MLKKVILVLSVLTVTDIAYCIHFPGLDVLRPFSSPETQQNAVYDLIERVFGKQYRSKFNLTVDPTLGGDSDVVIIDRGPQETIKISGGSGVAIAWGVHHFLRNCCGVHISWDGNQLKIPEILPHPAVRSMHHSIGRFRYYSNVCTFSYSFVWWNWTKWEQHLDWLALNGVNLPLASVAMEAIWQRVYQKLGLSQADIDAYFTGPAFLAWRRMGNLKGWAGPLSANWHAMQVELQHKILKRMVDLGMIPVLPTFAGHVPDAIQRFVEPTDPLFQKIGSMFMTEMKAEFGLYHAYSADPFNEMSPKSYDKPYLDAVGKAIYRSMSTVDPDAVWVVQAWMFVGGSEWQKNDAAKTFLTSVPAGKLLVLDLYSEQEPMYQLFESFYGQPYVWNVLHNFGGKLGMYGAVTKINEYLFNATKYPNTTLVGVGLTMEGIYQNYPIYQFTLDRAWSRKAQKSNQSNWISHYARQRYGNYDEHLENAWNILWTSVYDLKDIPNRLTPAILKRALPFNLRGAYVSSLMERPKLNTATEVKLPQFFQLSYIHAAVMFQPGYDPKQLCNAWKLFVYRADGYSNSSLFRLDLVDLTREVLLLIAGSNYRMMMKAYTKQDTESTQLYGNKLLKLFDDLEQLLSTHEHFLLGRWIKEARAKGKTQAESDQYEYNLRNQLTLWGPNGEILDYARKEWAGLVADYYKPRWLLFVNMLLDSLLPGGARFSDARYNRLVFGTVEKPFTFRRNPYPDEPIGDAVQVAKMFYDTYSAECQLV